MPPRSASPGDQLPPPHSPISPKGVAAKLANMEPYNKPKVMDRLPDPVSIAESDNPDVIALRSALMILQMQRETATKDIQRLAKLKSEVVKDPEAYVKELVRRDQHATNARSTSTPIKEDLLAPTLRYLVEGLGKDSEFLQPDPTGTGEQNDKEAKIDSGNGESEDDVSRSRFPAQPKEQNVYRMPPINWSKYQLAGAGLEKLHHDQQTRPSAGQPAVPVLDGGPQAERYVMAAAYQPVVDAGKLGHVVDHPMQTRRKDRKR